MALLILMCAWAALDIGTHWDDRTRRRDHRIEKAVLNIVFNNDADGTPNRVEELRKWVAADLTSGETILDWKILRKESGTDVDVALDCNGKRSVLSFFVPRRE